MADLGEPGASPPRLLQAVRTRLLLLPGGLKGFCLSLLFPKDDKKSSRQQSFYFLAHCVMQGPFVINIR